MRTLTGSLRVASLGLCIIQLGCSAERLKASHSKDETLTAIGSRMPQPTDCISISTVGLKRNELGAYLKDLGPVALLSQDSIVDPSSRTVQYPLRIFSGKLSDKLLAATWNIDSLTREPILHIMNLHASINIRLSIKTHEGAMVVSSAAPDTAIRPLSYDLVPCGKVGSVIGNWP